jgi:hypothetical protein
MAAFCDIYGIQIHAASADDAGGCYCGRHNLTGIRAPPGQPQVGDSTTPAASGAGSGDAETDFEKEFNKTFGQLPNAPPAGK